MPFRPILNYKRRKYPDVNATEEEMQRYFVEEFQRIEQTLDTSNNAIVTTKEDGELTKTSVENINATVNQQGTDLAGAIADITSEQTVRASQDLALASDITSLTSTVNQQGTDLVAAEAAILNEQTARATADSALAQDITSLTATVGGVSASVSVEATARVNADTSLSNSISAAATAASEAQSTADGKIVTFYQNDAPSGSDSSTGDIWFDTNNGNKVYRYSGSAWQEAKDSDIAIAINNAATAQATATTAQTNAALANALATSAENDAVIAQATADGKVTTFYQDNAPTAEGVGDLWVDTNDANKLYRWDGTQWISVQDGTISSLEARYGVGLNVDGYVTGFVQNNDGTSGSFAILADEFKIVDPNGGANGTQQEVFAIDNGVIRINAKVGTSVLDNNAVTVLTSAYSSSDVFTPYSTNYLYDYNNWETAVTTTHSGTGAPVIINWSTRAHLRNGTGTGNYTYSNFYVRILKTVGTTETIVVNFGMLTQGTSTSLYYTPVAGTYVDTAGSGGANNVTYKLQFNRAGYYVGAFLNSMAVLEAKK